MYVVMLRWTEMQAYASAHYIPWVLGTLLECFDEFSVVSGFPESQACDRQVRGRILDVTHLQWACVTVRVESSCGGLSFWARSVQIAAGLSAPRRRARRP